MNSAAWQTTFAGPFLAPRTAGGASVLFIEDETISRTQREVQFRNQKLTINPLHLLVWVALTPRTSRPYPPQADCYFPAIADSGFNGTLFIRKDHFVDWAGTPLSAFPSAGSVTPTYADGHREQQPHPRYDGDLWLRSNNPAVPPRRIELNRGFILARQQGPPVPLLGSLALRRANAQLLADYGRLVFSLRPRSNVVRALCGLWLESQGQITRDQLMGLLREQTVQRASRLGSPISLDQACLILLLRLCCGGPRSLVAEAEELAVLSPAEANALRVLLGGLSSNGQDPNTRLGQLVAQAGYLAGTQVESLLNKFEQLFPPPR
jgi:hypothetical protein